MIFSAFSSHLPLWFLFNQVPAIGAWSDDGQRFESTQGQIEFRDVHFRYPTRSHQQVLSGLNLHVEPGQYPALVGASGCSKSTIVSLVERFYDPEVGGMYLDGFAISFLNVVNYRSFFSLVSQEPSLYQGTLHENLLFGVARTDIPEIEII